MQQYFCDFLWTNLIEMEIVMQSPANPRSPQLRVSRQAVKGNLFNIPETDSGQRTRQRGGPGPGHGQPRHEEENTW